VGNLSFFFSPSPLVFSFFPSFPSIYCSSSFRAVLLRLSFPLSLPSPLSCLGQTPCAPASGKDGAGCPGCRCPTACPICTPTPGSVVRSAGRGGPVPGLQPMRCDFSFRRKAHTLFNKLVRVLLNRLRHRAMI